MITQYNFNWNCTNNELCILIPNYGRGSYIRNTLWQFKTKLSIDNFKIVIINDGLHEDFSDLEPFNVRYFTFQRNDVSERNGCFVRNYFIKRAKCRNLLQKDPETILQPIIKGYDWIKEYSSITGQNIRPKYTLDINNSVFDIQTVDKNISYRVHWGCLMPLEWLKMSPYREEFHLYGYEDTTMYYEIKKLFGDWSLDDNLIVHHLSHPVNTKIYSDVHKMGELYNNFIPNNKEWGEG